MSTRRGSGDEVSQTRRPRATTPEARENQLVSLAVDLAERQLMNGTASSQVLSHYLKLGSSREKLEQARLEAENDLLIKKREILDSHKRIEELYEGAIKAMRNYGGHEPDPTLEEQEGYYDD